MTDSDLEKLKNNICELLRQSNDILTNLERQNTPQPVLEQVATVVVGLQIALDGLLNKYDYEWRSN